MKVFGGIPLSPFPYSGWVQECSTGETALLMTETSYLPTST